MQSKPPAKPVACVSPGRASYGQSPFFGVRRSVLMESLYFYNFLYGSFIYSMLIFMHTDR